MRSFGATRGSARLGLGTVQFGLNYGVTNTTGQVSAQEVERILAEGVRLGIDVLDTAALYGDSESVIGASPGAKQFRVVSKTVKFDGEASAADIHHRLQTGIDQSLARLQRPVLDALLVHQARDLIGPVGDALWAALVQAKQDGRVLAIGASVYDGAEIDALLGRFPLDIVQLPLNAIDHRLVDGGQLSRLAEAGVEIHARSALLQGLLMVAPEQLEPRFATLRPALTRLRNCCAETGLPLLALLLGAVLRHTAIARVIVGVTSAAELSQVADAAILAVAHAGKVPYRDFQIEDPRILNPALWSTLK